MHVHLAPGERLAPGTEEAAAHFLSSADVDALVMPLRPRGDSPLERAASRYLSTWDRRFVHRMNHFVPAGRVITRAPIPGPRAADAAPYLADAIAAGRRVEALPDHAVLSPFARDLDAWRGWAATEGSAWGELARRDPRFPPFLPVLDRRGWWRHNVQQSGRRVIECLEAVRRPDPLALGLHIVREAAWTGACARAYGRSA